MQAATDILVWSIVIHLIADWLLQTEWMATFKTSLRHPAAWVHSSIHTLGLCLILPWPIALFVGVSHLWIDTRQPLFWWMYTVKRIPADMRLPVIEIWLDQVMHITVLAGVALWLGR